jgi:hypothetical protein
MGNQRGKRLAKSFPLFLRSAWKHVFSPRSSLARKFLIFIQKYDFFETRSRLHFYQPDFSIPVVFSNEHRKIVYDSTKKAVQFPDGRERRSTASVLWIRESCHREWKKGLGKLINTSEGTRKQFLWFAINEI